MGPKDRPPAQLAADCFVTSWSPLQREYVTELQDNPDGFDKGPLEVGRVLPGSRVALTLSTFPAFTFVVRVVRDDEGHPQVVDLRMRPLTTFRDVAITNADLKKVPIAALAAFAVNPDIPGLEFADALLVGLDDSQPSQDVKRPPGRPAKLTDDFLRDVTRLAREAWESEYPINSFVAGALHEEGKIDRLVKPETVRGWRRAAAARRQLSPDDTSFLERGELRGKPRKDT